MKLRRTAPLLVLIGVAASIALGTWPVHVAFAATLSIDTFQPHTVQVLPVKNGGGLAAGPEENLPHDLTIGLARRLAERSNRRIQISEAANFAVEGELSRSPDKGPYLWIVRLFCQKEPQQRRLAAQWVGTARSTLSLSFYRGTARIDTDGLVGEMAERIRRTVVSYQPEPGGRCFREIETLSTDAQDAVTAELQPGGGTAAAKPSVYVTGRMPGKAWCIVQSDGKPRMPSSLGVTVKPGIGVKIPYPADAQELWILIRADGNAQTPHKSARQKDPNAPQGDEFVGVIELLPGYGDTETAVVKLLDEMRNGTASSWYLKRVPVRGRQAVFQPLWQTQERG